MTPANTTTPTTSGQTQAARRGSPESAFKPHRYAEHKVDLGEITMNYAVAGEASRPALLLVPQQTESWWGYEAAMDVLSADFQCFAVDLRGQGRTDWTPHRYSLDNFGNDLVRFIDLVVKRPVIVAGNSSGGLIAVWLAAFAKPGQIRGALSEDPPIFAAEDDPVCGHGKRQAIGPLFELRSQFLGDQWRIGDWAGYMAAVKSLPFFGRFYPQTPEPPQHLVEYDPEWARMRMPRSETYLTQVKAPVLLTHHTRFIHAETGVFVGALSEIQAQKAGELIRAAGASFTYQSFPKAAHAMHATEPEAYAAALRDWAAGIA